MVEEIARGTSKELTLEDSMIEHTGWWGDCEEYDGPPLQVIMEPEGVGSYGWLIRRGSLIIARWNLVDGGEETPGEGTGWEATVPPEALGAHSVNSCPYGLPAAYIGDTKSTVTVPIDSQPGIYTLNISSSDSIINFTHSVTEFEIVDPVFTPPGPDDPICSR